MKARFLALVALLVLTAVVARGEIVVVAAGGDSAPDGNGKLFDFEVPSMNDSGQVTFVATLNGTTAGSNDNTAILAARALLVVSAWSSAAATPRRPQWQLRQFGSGFYPRHQQLRTGGIHCRSLRHLRQQ
jgi:hypothetical protein